MNMTGNGFDKWFDKSLVIIVHQNGVVGFNAEHTTAEATVSIIRDLKD